MNYGTCDDPGDRPTVAITPENIPAPDPHFGDGWAAALRAASADPAWSAAQTTNRAAYDDHVNQLSLVLDSLPEPVETEGDAATTTSVSGLVTYATCPKRFFWSEVDHFKLYFSKGDILKPLKLFFKRSS